jgi:hypothetical protein
MHSLPLVGVLRVDLAARELLVHSTSSISDLLVGLIIKVLAGLLGDEVECCLLLARVP